MEAFVNFLPEKQLFWQHQPVSIPLLQKPLIQHFPVCIQSFTNHKLCFFIPAVGMPALKKIQRL
jgi:hypothetical protein